jgi:hypothetical protein
MGWLASDASNLAPIQVVQYIESDEQLAEITAEVNLVSKKKLHVQGSTMMNSPETRDLSCRMGTENCNQVLSG